MALFYVYWFALEENDRVAIYAESRTEAERKYEEYFGKKPGELIKRDNW